MTLAQQILTLLQDGRALKAKELSEQLGVDKSQINSALYGELAGRVQQDNAYRWSLPNVGRQAPIAPDAPRGSLARACAYYLDCLAQDDLGGVSLWLTSKFGLDYAELPTLPSEAGDLFKSKDAQDLLRKQQSSRKPLELHVGYPVRIRSGMSRKGTEYFRLEPLLILSLDDSGETRVGPPRLTGDPPQLNLEALRPLSAGGGQAVMEEVLALSEALGMSGGSTEADLEEVALRLRTLRPEWDWREPVDADALSSAPPLTSIREQGIYNRAILTLTERSPYTRGLETELGELTKVAPSRVQETALEPWFGDQPEWNQDRHSHAPPLLEVLPLNTEQREAVRRALREPLTVITGPPGTGKSQVVSAILQNAAWSGQSVLFASKNHKAVDVVQTRVNELSPRPVLLRLGQQDSQERLAEYLTSLLASRPATEDSERFKAAQAEYQALRSELVSTEDLSERLVDRRNATDQLEKQAEQARSMLGPDLFASALAIDARQLADFAAELRTAVSRADRSQAPPLVALLWLFLGARRQEGLSRLRPRVLSLTSSVGIDISIVPAASDLGRWWTLASALDERVQALRRAQSYLRSLKDLRELPTLESLHARQRRCQEDLARVSSTLWESWLRLQPARLTREQRRSLGEYVALLRAMASGPKGGSGARQRYQKYFASFKEVSKLLPCWGITSLSARGRLPFEPGVFDLLVIDEASQCDISSALPLLYRAKRAVVIGDPRQLRHITKLASWQDQALLEKHEVPHRLSYASMSLFDSAASITASYEDVVQLRDHHRSHADVIGFSNAHFYEGALRVATRYDLLRRPRDQAAVRWMDVKGQVQRPGGGGAFNPAEAKAVVAELRRLLVEQSYAGTVGVVAPFRAQANRIRDLVAQDQALSERSTSSLLLIDTVHRFQGDERDVMIFSPTISEGTPAGALGFLQANPHLFNVALTRARAALIVVGDKGAATASGVSYLRSFAEYVDHLAAGASAGDSIDRVPTTSLDYPSVARPELVSDWERVLYAALSQEGIPTIPQFVEERFILDFAVIARQRRLAIEVDGERYHRAWDGELIRKDQLRNLRLLELGWDVMRFWVYQVRDDLPACVAQVREWLDVGDGNAS
ncbi:MAG: AAA family ATPase [Armatimonadetes bacterium]|nr:AAA family ATPase [Armatimonadota bacterium]